MILIASFGMDIKYKEEKECISRIAEICKNKAVACFSEAHPDKKRRDELALRVINKFAEFSIKCKYFNFETDFKINKLEEFDCLYFCGGASPLRLINKFKSKNLDKYFDLWHKKGKIIIGQSAGAMILFKTFFDKNDKDEWQLYKGLGLIKSDKNLFPHYGNDEGLRDSLTNFAAENKEQILPLPDYEYLEFE